MASIVALTNAAATSCTVLQPSLSSRSARASRNVISVKCSPVKQVVTSKIIRASAEVEESAYPSKTAVFLTSLVGAAAALSISFGGSALAELGPGNDGSGRTAEKADELLQAADSLTTNESPPRYGPGRSAPDETSISAQKAGSGVKDNVTGIQKQIGQAGDDAKDLFGQAQDGAKSGASDVASSISDVASKSDAASDVASKASDITDKASDISQGNNFFSSIQGAFKNLTGSASSGVDEAKDKASSAVEEAKSSLPGQ